MSTCGDPPVTGATEVIDSAQPVRIAPGLRGVPPRDTDRSSAYVRCMLTTLLVIAGVFLGLVGLLALIVSLSARPATRPGSGWVADTGRRHPDAGPRR